MDNFDKDINENFNTLTLNSSVKLHGHNNTMVRSAKFSPDGNLIVSDAWDQTIRVWDASTGREIQCMNNKNDVSATLITQDNTAVIAFADGMLQLCDIESGEIIKQVDACTSRVRSISLSPCGKFIISGDFDKQVMIWDATTLELQVRSHIHDNWVNCVDFSPDSTRVLSCDWSGPINIWDFTGNERTITCTGHTAPVLCAAFNSNGTRIVSGGLDRTVRIWDASNGEQVKMFVGHLNDVISVQFTSDDTRVVSSSRDRTVRVWDIMSEKQLNIIHTEQRHVHSLNFDCDCTRMVVIYDGYIVKVHDIAI